MQTPALNKSLDHGSCLGNDMRMVMETVERVLSSTCIHTPYSTKQFC
jgi:hypothetical protein